MAISSDSLIVTKHGPRVAKEATSGLAVFNGKDYVL